MDEVTGDEDASKDEIFGSEPVILCIIGPTGEEKMYISGTRSGNA